MVAIPMLTMKSFSEDKIDILVSNTNIWIIKQVYYKTQSMLSNKQKSTYNYLDELEGIRRGKQRRTERLSWKDYVMPEMASRHKDFECVRAASEYGKYEKDFSADTCENTNTVCSDKERIDVLSHQNANLKEELQYLRETLLKLLEQKLPMA